MRHTYRLEIRKPLFRKLKKLRKKNPKQLKIINKKIEEIRKTPYIFKPLRYALKKLRRVRIDKSFVLVFSIDEKTETVILEDFDHHDKIYKVRKYMFFFQ